jgi:hypothetical protein
MPADARRLLMPDVGISRSDIEQLARKLDTLRGHFTADEWTLLSAVLDAAIETMDRAGSAAEGEAAGAAGMSRPATISTYDPGSDAEPDPDKIGNSMYDHVLSTFTAGEEDDASSDPGPDKIGRA